MKKISSIFNTIMGQCLPAFMMLAGAMTLLEFVLFRTLGLGCSNFGSAVSRSFAVPVFALALAAMGFVSARFAAPGDNMGDRLSLMSVSPAAMYLIIAFSMFILYIVLWGLQCALIALFGRIFASASGMSIRAVYLDYIRDPVLQALIPQRGRNGWILCVGMLLMIAQSDSMGAFSLKGSGRFDHVLFMMLCSMWFVRACGWSSSAVFLITTVIVLDLFIFGIAMVRISGRKEAEDDEEE